MIAFDGQAVRILRISPTCLAHIKEKRKTIEARLASAAMKRVLPGDIIRFESETEHLHVRVLSVRKYESFVAMLHNEGIKNCVPDCPKTTDAVAAYHRLPNYKRWAAVIGVVAFRISTDLHHASGATTATIP